MDFLTNALKNLPAVAGSSTAFVGYILVVVAWLLISLRVRRNRQLLQNLEKLPESQRLEALRLEMGVVSVKGGLTADQWIRTRIHQYLFVGFCIVVALVVVLFAISALAPPTAPPAADVTVYQPDKPLTPDSPKLNGGPPPYQTLEIDNAYDGSGVKRYGTDGEGPGEPTPMARLTYDYQRIAAGIVVRPSMPYLDLLHSGGPIENLEGLLIWQFPKLAIKILNNTRLALLVTEVAVQVDSSVVDLEPILRTRYAASGTVPLINEGWGSVRDPQIQFDLRKVGDCQPANEWRDTLLPYRVALATFKESSSIPFLHLLNQARNKHLVDQDGDLCVLGIITFATHSGQRRLLKFRSRQNVYGLGGGVEAKVFYDLFLKAGEQGYTKFLPVSHSLQPGESEQFAVRIGTDRSARFDLVFTLRGAGGVSIPTDRIELNLFVPRTGMSGRGTKLFPTHTGWKLRP